MYVQLFNDLSPVAMYDRTQTDETIRDGDIFVCAGGKIVGFLNKAWPVVLFGEDESGELHKIAPGHAKAIDEQYPGLFAMAQDVAMAHGISCMPQYDMDEEPSGPEPKQLLKLELDEEHSSLLLELVSFEIDRAARLDRAGKGDAPRTAALQRLALALQR